MIKSILLVTCLVAGVEDGGKNPSALLERAQKAFLKGDEKELRACLGVSSKKREKLLVRSALLARALGKIHKVGRKKFGDFAYAESLGKASFLLTMVTSPFGLLNEDLKNFKVKKNGEEAIARMTQTAKPFSLSQSIGLHRSEGRWYLGRKKEKAPPKGVKKALKAAEAFARAAASVVKSCKDGSSFKERMKPIVKKLEMTVRKARRP
jgi:hypothetical protein